MTLATDPTQRAIALFEQLPPDKRSIALTFLEQLAQKISPEETQLLQKIHQTPIIDRQRLTELRDRCEWETLTPAEHQELIQYEEQLEIHNADRVAAIMQLAQLKNLDFQTLYKQLTPSQIDVA